ncbi:MAG: hypothetical protein DRQ55_14535 [Planctomycetota bacterium]|nr:MAG: hypothetical protein DRQ55_14535 [Planctomycetota bacterium]
MRGRSLWTGAGVAVVAALLGLAWWLGEWGGIDGGVDAGDPVVLAPRAEQASQLPPELDAVPAPSVQEAEALVGHGVSAAEPGRTGDPGLFDLDAPSVGDLLVRARFEDGRPAQGVALQAFSRGPGRSVDQAPRVVRVDEQGEALFKALRMGSVDVYGVRGGEVSGQVQPGVLTELELVLPAGRLVRGQVVDPQGLPVGSADIWLSGLGLAAQGAVVTQSDRVGYFAIEAVGRWRHVAAMQPPRTPSPLHSLEGDADPDALITLALGSVGAELRGRVVDRRGAPIAGARVVVGWDGGVFNPLLAPGTGPPPEPAFSGEDGGFAFQALPWEQVMVTCRAPGYAAIRRLERLSVDEPAEIELRLPPGCEVHGVVTDGQGQPLADAVVLWGEGYSFMDRRGVTDAHGRYLLDGLDAGGSWLKATHGACLGQASVRLQLRPGQPGSYDLVLQRGASLAGRVWDAVRDEPIPGWLVVAHRSDQQENWGRDAETDASGEFELVGLGAGPFTVRVVDTRSGALPQTMVEQRDVTSADGPLEFLVTTRGHDTGAVSVCLLGAEDQPPTAGQVMLERIDGVSSSRGGNLDDGGCVTIDELAAGEYALRAHVADTGGVPSMTLRVAPGRTTDLGVLRLLAGGRVRVSLTAAPDVPLDRLRLWYEADDGRSVPIPHDGLAALSPAVAAGTGAVTVRGNDIAQDRFPVVIEEGRDSLVQVDVRRGVVQHVAFRWPGSGNERRRYGWRAQTHSGRVVISRPRCMLDDPLDTAVIRLAPGNYELIVWSAAMEELRVPFKLADGVRNDVLEIDMD